MGDARQHRVVIVFRPGPGDTVARDTSDDTLLAWSLRDLRTVFGIEVEPVDVRVHRWLDAMPQYAPGHGALVAELRAGSPPGLAVAGSYLDGIGVPACVAAADRAVNSLRRPVGTRGPWPSWTTTNSMPPRAT